MITPCGGGGGGGGIQFDTDPQSGNWLLIDTVGALPSGIGSGFGIVLRPTDGMMVYTASAIALFAGSFSVASDANIALTAAAPGASLTLNSTRIVLDGGLSHFDLKTGELQIQHYTGPIKVIVGASSVFTVYESNGTTKAFEVRDNGTVHIRTGQTVLADL